MPNTKIKQNIRSRTERALQLAAERWIAAARMDGGVALSDSEVEWSMTSAFRRMAGDAITRALSRLPRASSD